jgi:hypothetical protein
LLAVIRLRWISEDVGQRLTMPEAMLAFGAGQVAGAVTIQFFGQIAARSALLGPRGVSPSANIVIAGYERLIAVAVSFGLAATGGLLLFGRIGVDWSGSAHELAEIVIGCIAALSLSAWLGWGRLAAPHLTLMLNRKTFRALARGFAITLAIQLLTATAYVLLAQAFVPDAPWTTLLAGSLIVMFAASLPISFAGWGIRELSAVFVLSFVGLQASAAVVLALMIGALALVSVIVLTAIAALLVRRKPGVTASAQRASGPGPAQINRLVSWILPLAAAIAVLFQIHVPTSTAPLNVNLADPIAILAGLLFALTFFRKAPDWRLSDLNFQIVLATGVMTAAFAHGYSHFGWIDWAATNKFAGWFVLLGYAGAGALLVREFRLEGLRVLCGTFVGATAGVVGYELLALTLTRAGFDFAVPFTGVPLEGFSQNRNAFSFTVLLAICCLPLFEGRGRKWLLVLFCLALWFAGSAAALGALCVLFALSWAAGILPRRELLCGVACTALALAVEVALPVLASSLDGGNAAQPSVWVIAFGDGGSSRERWSSIVDGLRLFLSDPVVGAGLGAHVRGHDKPVVIHSTPIWILAEMGIVGFLIFLLVPARILLTECKTIRLPVSAMLVMIVVTLAVMSSVHEMMYQRAMWLLLGAALALPRASSGRESLQPA